MNEKILSVQDGNIVIKSGEKTYAETLDNFVTDGGVLPVSFKTINYSDSGSCLINGTPGDVPAYALNVIERIDDFIRSKDERVHASAIEKIDADVQKQLEEEAQEEQERIDAMSPEERAEHEIEQRKIDRAAIVSSIMSEVDGMTFNGDETAQTRMARAIIFSIAYSDIIKAKQGVDVSYLDVEVPWIMSDNTTKTVTIAQLAEAGYIAMQKQAEIWGMPYDN